MGRPVVWAVLHCENCGVLFRVKPCDARGGRRFCSVGCRSNVFPPPMTQGNQFAWRGDKVKRGALHYRARKIRSDGVCVQCGGVSSLTHHIDENPSNNDPANLERLCRKCHMNHHRRTILAGRKG